MPASAVPTPELKSSREERHQTCALDDLLLHIIQRNTGLSNASPCKTTTRCDFLDVLKDVDSSSDDSVEALFRRSVKACSNLQTPLEVSEKVVKQLCRIWLQAITSPHFDIVATEQYGGIQLGLVAKTDLAKGTIVDGLEGWMLDLTRHGSLRSRRMMEGVNEKLTFDEGRRIKIGLGPMRLLNHSCDPNVLHGRSWKREKRHPLSFAQTCKEIKKGEPLVFFYGAHWFGKGNRDCKCGNNHLHATGSSGTPELEADRGGSEETTGPHTPTEGLDQSIADMVMGPSNHEGGAPAPIPPSNVSTHPAPLAPEKPDTSRARPRSRSATPNLEDDGFEVVSVRLSESSSDSIPPSQQGSTHSRSAGASDTSSGSTSSRSTSSVRNRLPLYARVDPYRRYAGAARPKPGFMTLDKIYQLDWDYQRQEFEARRAQHRGEDMY